MATEPVRRKWTVDEYLAYEQETGIKHEYIDGEIYAMTGGTGRHGLIASNMGGALYQRLRDNPCRAYSSDVKIHISNTKFVYPGVSVVCGEAQFADDEQSRLTNPVMIVEVLSPSTADYDRGQKFDFYKSVTSVQHYLLLEQNTLLARLYTRRDKGWFLQEFTDSDDELPLNALEITVPLRDVYLDVVFESDKE